METPAHKEVPLITEEDIKAALELIAETPELSDNARVKQLAENGFVTEDGRQLDPGHFLSNMLAHLEMMDKQPEPLSPTERIKKIEEAMVVHSRPTSI